MSTKQERIATLARINPAMAFTSLNHYVDYDWMRYSYELTRKDGAVGVDGQTAEAYARDLERNLLSLIDRLKSGRYHALPVRRHYIPKSDGQGQYFAYFGITDNCQRLKRLCRLVECAWRQMLARRTRDHRL